jgi:hypothetical protein
VHKPELRRNFSRRTRVRPRRARRKRYRSFLKCSTRISSDDYIAGTVNPRSRRYHRFLSLNEFKAQFAPSNQQVKLVTDYMRSKGIAINEVYSDNLLIKATGTVELPFQHSAIAE